jgi:hypothetical protein
MGTPAGRRFVPAATIFQSPTNRITLLNEHQKETAFLRRCISFEEGAAGRQLDEQIAQIQRDDRSLHRAAWLLLLVAALAVAGFGYLCVLMEDFPAHLSRFANQFITKSVCALGVGSLISLLAFAGLGIRNRRELNLRREECRRLVTKLLESRLGKHPAPDRNGKLKEVEVSPLRSELAVPAAASNNPPRLS